MAARFDRSNGPSGTWPWKTPTTANLTWNIIVPGERMHTHDPPRRRKLPATHLSPGTDEAPSLLETSARAVTQ